jgi:hypothetical protein
MITMPSEKIKAYKRDWQRKWRADHRKPWKGKRGHPFISPFEKAGHCPVCGMLLSSDCHFSCPYVQKDMPKCLRCVIGNLGRCIRCGK